MLAGNNTRGSATGKNNFGLQVLTYYFMVPKEFNGKKWDFMKVPDPMNVNFLKIYKSLINSVTNILVMKYFKGNIVKFINGFYFKDAIFQVVEHKSSISNTEGNMIALVNHFLFNFTRRKNNEKYSKI
jgi:hypothetical protein